jgi:AraC-like DNA-binding protein
VLADLNLKELLVRLLQSQRLLRGKRDMASETNNNRIQFVLHYINAHLMDKILINELCRKAYLSRNAFFIWFREQFGITPVDYINNERMKLAKQMLAEGRYNVSQVSMLCGFSDVNYFVRMFKKVEGITPGAYLACLKHNTLIVS